MSRSVNSVASLRRRKRILKRTKGYFGRRKNVWTIAKNAYNRANEYSYRDRRQKKRMFKKLWIQRINAGARMLGLSYSALMNVLNKSKVEINRKGLAGLVMNDFDEFKRLVNVNS